MKIRLTLLPIALAFLFSCKVYGTSPEITLKNVIGFVQNKGQIKDQSGRSRPDVLYMYQTNEFKLILRSDGFSYELLRSTDEGANHPESGVNTGNIKDDEDADDDGEDIPVVDRCITHRIDVNFIRPQKNIVVEASGQSDYFFNYYTSSHPQTKVHAFDKVQYLNVFKGIDLVFYFTKDEQGNRLPEYEWIIHPNGKSENIQLAYNGAKSISVNDKGCLIMNGALGFVQEQRPVLIFSDASKQPISFQLKSNRVSFERISRAQSDMIIDPVLSWGTYFGGKAQELPDEIATDSTGNSFITGTTKSKSKLATRGAFDTEYNGNNDAFVAKFNTFGELMWATYYGGDGDDVPYAITLDPNQDPIIGGKTKSDSFIADYPGRCTIQCALASNLDAFVSKFSNDDGYLIMSTYVGGGGEDQILGVACNTGGDIYINGFTESRNNIAMGDVQDTSYNDKAHQDMNNGDIMVMRFNNALTQKIWGTYYGSFGKDRGHNLAVDPFGHIYESGTIDGNSYHLATQGAFDTTKTGDEDAFLACWYPTGKLKWFTYYGGIRSDRGRGVAADASGNVYLVGYTRNNCDSNCNEFSTPGAYETTHSLTDDEGFIAKFDSSGHRIWATYFGGNNKDILRSVKVGASGAPVYVEGVTMSGDLPLTPDAYQKQRGGAFDNMFEKFNWDGSQLLYSSYYGGSENESPDGTAYYESTMDVDPAGNIYITSPTNSTDSISTDGTKLAKADQFDVYVVKFMDACGNDPDPFEPNDDFTKAPEISLNPATKIGVIHALIQQKNDVDYYSFIAPTPKVQIALSNLAANYDLYLYTSTFVPIDSSKRQSTTSDTIIERKLVIGNRYYMRVKPADSTAFSAAQCYTLAVAGISTGSKNSITADLKAFTASLYPNPASSNANMLIENNSDASYTISILDLLGNVISVTKSQVPAGEHSLELNTRKLAAGSYFVRVNSNNTEQVLKLILSR